MKTYIITAFLDRYTDNYSIFQGESLDDPKMRQEILKWLTTFKDENYDFDGWCKDGLDQKITSSRGIKAYEITGEPMLVPDIWKDLRTYIDKCEEKHKEIIERQDKERRRKDYEKLKMEFE